MRLRDFLPLQPFRASIRLPRSRFLTKTVVWSDNVIAARKQLQSLFGDANVFVVQPITLREAKAHNPQDPQIQALQQRANALRQQAKAMKARTAVKSAEEQLTKARKAAQPKPRTTTKRPQ